MSAFEGKADMTFAACLLSRSLSGVKRTWPIALDMSAFDPKRTSLAAPRMCAFGGKTNMLFARRKQLAKPALVIGHQGLACFFAWLKSANFYRRSEERRVGKEW